MGGIGGGRREGISYLWRATCDSARGIDVRRLHREHGLRPGAEVVVEGADGAAREVLALAWTPCRVRGREGQRPWLVCPGCGRRCVALYELQGKPHRCRLCHGLPYASQYATARQRHLDKADALARRVGGHGSAVSSSHGCLGPFPPKPRGMRRTTYLSLYGRWLKARAAGFAGL